MNKEETNGFPRNDKNVLEDPEIKILERAKARLHSLIINSEADLKNLLDKEMNDASRVNEPVLMSLENKKKLQRFNKKYIKQFKLLKNVTSSETPKGLDFKTLEYNLFEVLSFSLSNLESYFTSHKKAINEVVSFNKKDTLDGNELKSFKPRLSAFFKSFANKFEQEIMFYEINKKKIDFNEKLNDCKTYLNLLQNPESMDKNSVKVNIVHTSTTANNDTTTPSFYTTTTTPQLDPREIYLQPNITSNSQNYSSSFNSIVLNENNLDYTKPGYINESTQYNISEDIAKTNSNPLLIYGIIVVVCFAVIASIFYQQVKEIFISKKKQSNEDLNAEEREYLNPE